MKKYLVIAMLGIFLYACSSSARLGNNEKKSPEMKEYHNEFFSIKYPSAWEYEEEISNMCDTIPEMSKGIRSTFYNSNPYSPCHTVIVQKSAMFECFKTPEKWRDLSIEFKHFDDRYIGILDSYMLDSLKYGPYPAAMAGFVVALESGDTLIHKQMVVMVDKDLYYLNNTFDWHDDGSLELLGDFILSTVRFKK